MRDGWYPLVESFRGCGDEEEVLVWSLDYDGCSDVVRTVVPPVDPETVPRGAPWPRVRSTHLAREDPDPKRLEDFWTALAHASGRDPSLVLSGSARVVVQDVGVREQDGLSHTAVQSAALAARGLPRIHLPALKRGDLGGTIRYDPNDVHVPNVDYVTRMKMDLVRKQIRYVAARTRKRIRFVFVDDIYAEKLRDLLVAHPELLPPRATLHLVAFVSYRPRRAELRAYEVIPNVLFTPY